MYSATKKFSLAADSYARAIAANQALGSGDGLWTLYLLQASALQDADRWPEAKAEGYTRKAVEAALPVIEAAQGRTFFLFISLRAMREARELIETGMKKMGMDYPLLMQGEGSRTELLERFRRLGNAVLLGSQSCWEGVDVRGEALSLVIIDRLPFAPPDDPVLAARIETINAEGRNAFMEYQLPQAVITLKQGAGRLISGRNHRRPRWKRGRREGRRCG